MGSDQPVCVGLTFATAPVSGSAVAIRAPEEF